MRITTLALVMNEEGTTFLMGNHQRGEGKGRLSFLGGKVADKPEFANETPEESVEREIIEEAGIQPISILHIADITYRYPASAEGKEELMKVYSTNEYSGTVKEDPEELILEWVPKDTIPYERMWPSDRLWLPKIFSETSAFYDIEFVYDKDGTLVKESYVQSGEPKKVL